MEDKLEKGQWRKWKPEYKHYHAASPKQFKVNMTGGFYTSYSYLGGKSNGCLESDIVLRHSDPCGRLESLALEYADNKAVTFDHNPYHLGQGFVAVKVGDRRFSFASDRNPRQDKAPLSQLVGMAEAALREHKRKERPRMAVAASVSMADAQRRKRVDEINASVCSAHYAPTIQEREILTGQIRILNQVLKETAEDRQRLQEKNRELALLVSDPGKTRQRMIDDVARMMSLSGYTSWKAILSEVNKMHCRLRRLESAFKGA